MSLNDVSIIVSNPNATSLFVVVPVERITGYDADIEMLERIHLLRVTVLPVALTSITGYSTVIVLSFPQIDMLSIER